MSDIIKAALNIIGLIFGIKIGIEYGWIGALVVIMAVILINFLAKD